MHFSFRCCLQRVQEIQKTKQTKKKLGQIQNRQQELQSEFVFWMGKQLPRQPEAHKAKQANKKLQKHAGSSLEAKIDTVLNAPGRVQPQIDSLT